MKENRGTYQTIISKNSIYVLADEAYFIIFQIHEKEFDMSLRIGFKPINENQL